MMKRTLLATLVFGMTACSNPNDIVFGPEPLKTLEEKGEQIRKIPEEDRKLLVGYLMANQLASKIGGAPDQVVGRTVGEVLTSAQKWKTEQEAKAAEAKKREEEAAALAAKVEAEKKAIAERISKTVTVAVTGKRILPEDMYARRFEDQLSIQYAIENKGEKAIQLLKGQMHFLDAAGDKVGWIPLTFDQKVAPGQTLKTDTGRIWKLTSYGPKELSKIAHLPMDGMKTRFEAESVAFSDGEVIKAPE